MTDDLARTDDRQLAREHLPRIENIEATGLRTTTTNDGVLVTATVSVDVTTADHGTATVSVGWTVEDDGQVAYPADVGDPQLAFVVVADPPQTDLHQLVAVPAAARYLREHTAIDRVVSPGAYIREVLTQTGRDIEPGAPVPDGGRAFDMAPSIGERVTYFDTDGEPHPALVTWVFGSDPGPAPMINCVRGNDFQLGETDASDGAYGSMVIHETSVDHWGPEHTAHAYTRGWDE